MTGRKPATFGVEDKVTKEIRHSLVTPSAERAYACHNLARGTVRNWVPYVTTSRLT